jgi:hypothetical protein
MMSPGQVTSGTITSGKIVALIPNDYGHTTTYCYQDHFLTGSDGSYTNWTAVAGTGASKSQVITASSFSPGQYQLFTGTQAGSATTGYGFITAANSVTVGTNAPTGFRCIFQLGSASKPTSTAASYSKFFIGLGTQPSNGTYPSTSFIGLVFDPNSGMANAATNFGFLTKASSNVLYTDTTVNFNPQQFYEFSFLWNYTPPGYVSGYRIQVAGTASTLRGPITGNTIPGSAESLCLVMLALNGASGTTSYNWIIDLWEVACSGSREFKGSSLIKNF